MRKTNRVGYELEMWVMSQCAQQLMTINDQDARRRIVEWLHARVVPQKQGVPQIDNPQQERLQFEAQPKRQNELAEESQGAVFGNSGKL